MDIKGAPRAGCCATAPCAFSPVYHPWWAEPRFAGDLVMAAQMIAEPERERRQRERWIGARCRREDGGREDIQVLALVMAQARVDATLARVGGHARCAHPVERGGHRPDVLYGCPRQARTDIAEHV